MNQAGLALAVVTHCTHACVPAMLRTRPHTANMGLHSRAVRPVPRMTILCWSREGCGQWGVRKERAVQAST